MLKKIANLARTAKEVASKYGCRISVSVKNKQKTPFVKATDLSTSGHLRTFSSIKKIRTGEIGRIQSIIFNIDGADTCGAGLGRRRSSD